MGMKCNSSQVLRGDKLESDSYYTGGFDGINNNAIQGGSGNGPSRLRTVCEPDDATTQTLLAYGVRQFLDQ